MSEILALLGELPPLESWNAVRTGITGRREAEIVRRDLLELSDAIKPHLDPMLIDDSLLLPIRADGFTRETLAIAEPCVRITGHLDWDHLRPLPPAAELGVQYTRLALNKDYGELWPPFIEGYREVTGSAEMDDNTFRFFALIRSVFSVTRGSSPDRAIGIIRHLIGT